MTPLDELERLAKARFRAMAPQHDPTPALQPGQRIVQMWSEPDRLGYRTLLTFELVGP